MNVLVTGGAGFIASHIVDALIDAGHAVSVLDNLSTGRREMVNGNASFYESDITFSDLDHVFSTTNPELVIHHAAQIDVQTSIRRPAYDAEVNILGTIRLLEQCCRHGVRKIIYASSAAVYGMPETAGITESHPVRPLSFYGISKHTPEHYIEAFSRLHGLDYTILRYSNVYGPRQDPKGEGGVVSIFTDHLLNGREPVIFGDGEQTRDFIYVKDIVSANMASLVRGSRSILNISRNESSTVNSLLRLMCGHLKQPFAPIYGPGRPGDITHSRLDNRAAADRLQWAPAYDLESGLKETLDYYVEKWKYAQ